MSKGKSGGGTVNVQAKTSTVGIVAACVIGFVLLAGLGNAGGLMIQGAGHVADEANPCNPADGRVFCPPSRVRAPTPTTVPTVSDEEMAKRQAAKTVGDSLPPLPAPATPAPSPGVPTLSNPSPGGSLMGQLPVVGNALEGAVKAIGPGMKAIGK